MCEIIFYGWFEKLVSMETVNSENSLSKDADSEDNDLLVKLKKLTDRVALHETEKQKMREEFGLQRAKMKELFLQKEDELKKGSTEHDRLKDVIKKLEADVNDARTQLTIVSLQLEGQIEEERKRYEEQVASLQQLITETVDESSKNEEEVKRLTRINQKLEEELEELRLYSSVGVSEPLVGSSGSTQLLTAPTAMISTLARKVVSQLGADSSMPGSLLQTQPATNVVPPPSENLEESMRKAQEDAEVLRSLVIPLEEEIKALKDKLRQTDEKLRKYENDYEQVADQDQSPGPGVKTQFGISIVSNAHLPSSDDDVSGSGIMNLNFSGDSSANTTTITPARMGGDGLTTIVSTCLPSAAQDGSPQPQDHTHPTSRQLHPDPDTRTNCNSNASVSSGILSSTSEVMNDNEVFDDKKAAAAAMITRPTGSCDMCANYELQLVAFQEKCKDLERQVASLERCKDELAKEALIRKDMEQKWNEKKEIHKAEVGELEAKVKAADICMKEVKQLYNQTKTQMTDELNRLTNERRNIQLQLDRLQLENENLVGKRNANARELQDEVINLPDNVEELQEMLLKCREDLISARVGQEAAEQEVGNLKEEAQLQRYQTQAENQNRQQLNNSLTTEVESLKSQLHKSDMARHQAQLVIQRLNTEEKNKRLEIEDLNVQLISTSNAKKQLEEQVSELKSRLSSLQAELHNSEIVQKDFVRLSQSLQQELERIRSSHTQVRWEHEDDVEQCPGCRQSFSGTRRKQHCRHCGRIFCISCLTHTVLSGPNQRPSKVCDVCHTLLVEDTAPYFSTEPPHSSN